MKRTASRAAMLGGAVAVLSALAPSAHAAAPGFGQFLLPQGDTFTLSNASLSGCDPLAYGYQVQNAKPVVVGTNAGQQCDTATPADVTVGPYPRKRLVEVYLVDSIGPTFTFYSTNQDHTAVQGTGPFNIGICDSYTGQSGYSTTCEGGASAPTYPSNLSVTLTVNAPTG